MAVVKRMTPRLRRTAGTSATVSHPHELVVRPSNASRVPGGLGAATFGALAQVRERTQALVELDEDLERSDEAAALLESAELLEQAVRRLVAAAVHASDRARRREHLEDLSTRSDALWALRRGGGVKDSTATSG